tara:strand:- start:5670 stop:6539 length:870 start_codon:yes stop_codon:yes gene_type:complete
MTKAFLTAVSALALIGAAPAMADTELKAKSAAEMQTERTVGQNDSPEVTKEEIKEGWNKTKGTVSEAAEDVSNATKKAYKDIKAALISDDAKDMDVTHVTINAQTTANGIIGQPIYNNNERVGTVKDIILDRNGKGIMVVIADGDFFGLGKLAAFDYNKVIKVSAEGDILTPLTEESIDLAAKFSYDRKDNSKDVRVIPDNGYSVAKLLDGQLVNAKNKALAHIDDIQFKGDNATYLIVGFDQILGFGGEKAALNYNSAMIIQDGHDYDFQINAEKTAQFESYKKSAVK